MAQVESILRRAGQLPPKGLGTRGEILVRSGPPVKLRRFPVRLASCRHHKGIGSPASLVPQGHHGIGFGRSTGWEITREKRHRNQH